MDFGAGAGGGRGKKIANVNHEDDDRGGRATADGRTVVMRRNRIRVCGRGGLSGKWCEVLWCEYGATKTNKQQRERERETEETSGEELT
jgi:hypothetical protein